MRLEEATERQRYRFLFTFRNKESGALIKEFGLPLNPENYDVVEMPRNTIHQTKGGAFEDVIGMGVNQITISGTFGFKGTYGKGITIKGVDMFGQEAFKELLLDFKELYDSYDSQKSNAGNPQQIIEFYDQADRRKFRVAINKFSYRRSISRQFLYQYTISMTGLSVLKDAKLSGVPATVTPTAAMEKRAREIEKTMPSISYLATENIITISSSVSLWSKLGNDALSLYKKASSNMAEVISQYNELSRDLDSITAEVGSFVELTDRFINLPFQMVREAISKINDLLAITEDIGELPVEFRKNLIDTAVWLKELRFYEGYFVTQTDTSGGNESATEEEMLADIQSVAIPQNPYTTATGVKVISPELTPYDNAVNKSVSSMEVSAGEGQTIQELAAIYLGDASQWGRIADLNDIDYPFELTAGQKVKIPTLEAQAVATVPSSEDDFAAYVYGTDEYLDEQGDMVVDGAGRPITITGFDNLVMQLRHRLKAKQGERGIFGSPLYGSSHHRFIGNENRDSTIEAAMLDAAECLERDYRVNSVRNAMFSIDQDGIVFEADITPIGATNPQPMRVLT